MVDGLGDKLAVAYDREVLLGHRDLHLRPLTCADAATQTRAIVSSISWGGVRAALGHAHARKGVRTGSASSLAGGSWIFISELFAVTIWMSLTFSFER